MSLLFGYMGNEPERIRCALYAARDTLQTDVGDNPDGWGIGFYQGGEVLLQKRPKATPGLVDFYGQIRDLRTDIVIGHVREATIGKAQKNENTHPYRFRTWLFAHSGTIDRFEQVKPDLLGSIPDFLRRNIRGQTDSEHLFHLFLAFLHDGGKLEDPNLTVQAVRGAARATVAFVDRLATAAGGEPGQLNLVATNGRILFATRRGRAMSLFRVSAVADCPVCREPLSQPGREPKRVAHEHLRAVLLLSNGVAPQKPGWEAVPEGSIVTVTHHLQTEVCPLKE